MLCLISREIDGVKVELNVDETLSNKVMGGQPFLTVGRECSMVFAVDSLKVIKAIANAETLTELQKSIKDVWNEKSIQNLIQKYNAKEELTDDV